MPIKRSMHHDEYGAYEEVCTAGMHQVPLVSVIMSVYNGERWLQDALRSILRQTLTDLELIVIDDGSQDASSAIIREEMRSDLRIRLISQKNIGLTKSLNRGLRLARGKYIARHDADDISAPTRLDAQVRLLEKFPDTAVVGTQVARLEADETAKPKSISQCVAEPLEIAKTLRRRNCISHGSVLLNKHLLGDGIRYDDRFVYAQDCELWARLSQKYPLRNIPEPLYLYRLSPGAISTAKCLDQCCYAALAIYSWRTGRMLFDQTPPPHSGPIATYGPFRTNRALRRTLAYLLIINEAPELGKAFYSRLHPMRIILGAISRYDLVVRLKQLAKALR